MIATRGQSIEGCISSCSRPMAVRIGGAAHLEGTATITGSHLESLRLLGLPEPPRRSLESGDGAPAAYFSAHIDGRIEEDADAISISPI